MALPTVHRFSRTDIKVNFDRWNTKKCRIQIQFLCVNKYYCELINHRKKHSKYPLPVFVPQRVTGLRNINITFVCLFVCVHVWRFHTFTYYSFITVCVCLCFCMCQCMLIFVYDCVWIQTKSDDNTIIIYNQVNGAFLSVGWQKRSLFSTHLFSQSDHKQKPGGQEGHGGWTNQLNNYDNISNIKIYYYFSI